jgi:hypothetical protein
MDFLDPKKQHRHKIMLIMGYILIACVVAGTTTILLYEAYGFGLGKGGNIIQNGLIYLSSQPNPATVYLNNSKSKNSTDTALTLPEGIYNVMLTRSGYRTWTRQVEVDGGMIENYTYPLLIPNVLQTSSVKSYSSQPQLATQSLNRRWLVVMQPGSDTNFDLYDLSNPSLAPTQIAIPAGVVTQPTTSESWKLVAWANDNQHVLLNHLYDGKNEYIMLDIANPSQSFNLSKDLSGVPYTLVTLDNENYSQYYLYDQSTDTLYQDSLSSPTTPTTILSGVLAYDTYGTNTVLYATNDKASSGKVYINELVGTTVYHIKLLDTGTTYLLNMASYSGSLYVVAGAASENKVYIFDNPVGQLQADPDQAPVPVQVLFVNNPNYVSFSINAQFVVAENGQNFAVYNLENSSGYNYSVNLPLDSPQVNATWMDGYRLTYVSSGKLILFEYDHNYQQTLMPASSNFTPFFTPSYDYVYSLTTGPNQTYSLTRTSLYTSADQPQKL